MLLFTHSFTHQKLVMSTYPEPGSVLGAGRNTDKTLLTGPSVLGTRGTGEHNLRQSPEMTPMVILRILEAMGGFLEEVTSQQRPRGCQELVR